MIVSDFFPLVSAIFVLAMGLAVIRRNFTSRLNGSFFLFCLAITIWMLGTFMMFINREDSSQAVFWDRFVYSGVVFIPAIMLDFVLALTKNKRFNSLYWLMILGYVVSLAFLPTVFTDYFVKGIFSYRWGIHTQAQILHHIFLIYFVIYLSLFFVLVERYYRKTTVALEKLQIKYIFIAFLILAIFGSISYLPAYGISIYPFSYLSGLFFVMIISYAILKYRLMDLRHIFRILLIYFIDAVIVYVFFNFLVFVYLSIWGSIWHPYALFSGLFIAPVFVYGLFSFNNLIIRFVDSYFFHSLYDYRQTITKLSSELNTYNDLDKIINLIVDTIKRTMGLNRTGVLLINKKGSEIYYKIAKVIGFDITNGISLVKDNFLTQYLKRTASPLVREELSMIARDIKSPREQSKFFELEQEMKHIEAHLCLPLINAGELLGIIVLGAKESGDPYTKQDLELLTTMSVQAAIAINNAKLYQETKNFNKILQQKVDEQTSELKKRAEHLEKLLKMREEFLDIASHQLKTPVSVIRGTISMFMDGSMDKLPDKEKKKFFDNIYQKATKLNVIINDILRASEIDTDEFVINPKTAQLVQLEDILNSVYKDLKDLANNKKIELKLILPKKKTSPILTNVDFLEQAIYNLVDNAIKYTPKGSVNLSLGQEGDLLKVKVKDTGIGIPQQDQIKIFDKFSRAGNAVNMYADGSGLGLFIVKKIIEAHDGGKIFFESKEGEGTIFTVVIKSFNKKISKKDINH